MSTPDRRVALIVGTDPPAMALARRLTADGARVCLTGPSPADRRAAPPGLAVLPADPADVSHQSAVIRAVLDRWGRLDLLVTCLPQTPATSLVEADSVAVAALLRHYVTTPLGWAQRAYWMWMVHREGRVLHVATPGTPGEGGTDLAVTMLTSLTRRLARELAPAAEVSSLVAAPRMPPERLADLAYVLLCTPSAVSTGETITVTTVTDELTAAAA